MTDAELDELEALSYRATPPPWDVIPADNEWWVMCFSLTVAATYTRQDDAELIAAMRNKLPELIREVRRLRQATE
jgi:hypothetical protein